MSKLRVKQPVVHIPSFNEYRIDREHFQPKLQALGLRVPLGMLDNWYYYTDMEGWGKILYNLTFKSSLYRVERQDCDWYAFKAFVECQDRYGLTGFGVALGATPLGPHAFNIFFTGDKFMLWEPNDAFTFAGIPFEIGENGYKPNRVVF